MTTGAPPPTAPAAGPSGKSRNHIPGLDGIRGLAILLVMISHFIIVGGNIDAETPLNRLLHSGFLGVDLFFVLSGFLITGILIDAKKSPNYFRAFYMRRALRIFPLYYGLLACAWLSMVFITPQDLPKLTGQDSMAWYWLYASNIGMAFKGGWLNSPTWIDLGHFWSLAVEEQFYLVWPLLVFLIPVKALERVCIFLVLTSPFVFPLLSKVIGMEAAYASTLTRLGSLAAGAWLAVLWRRAATWEKIEPHFLRLTLAAGFLLLLERSFFPIMYDLEATFAMLVGVGCIGLAAKGTGRFATGFLSSPILRWLGKYSYGIYVFHHALKSVWIHFLWDGWIVPAAGTGWLATLWYTAAATVASLSLAWLSWKFFEGPMLSLKDRFNYRADKA